MKCVGWKWTCDKIIIKSRDFNIIITFIIISKIDIKKRNDIWIFMIIGLIYLSFF